MQPTIEPPSLDFLPHISLVQVISLAFVLLFILWLVYTVVTSYHWLRYGHRSAVAIPAIITHILVSGYLALFAVSGLHP